jgi:hypothetical protein
MGDIRTPFDQAVYPDTADLSGDLATGRGIDPNVNLNAGGPGDALRPYWPDPVVPTPGGTETPNSLSGLPQLPHRFEPSEQPPSPPTLDDRNPGTIDEP